MSDERFRALERAALSGDPDVIAAYISTALARGLPASPAVLSPLIDGSTVYVLHMSGRYGDTADVYLSEQGAEDALRVALDEDAYEIMGWIDEDSDLFQQLTAASAAEDFGVLQELIAELRDIHYEIQETRLNA